jgi:hypothetical protein
VTDAHLHLISGEDGLHEWRRNVQVVRKSLRWTVRQYEYRGTSLIRNGFHKNQEILYLNLRMCNRPFFVNVLNFKNMQPTLFPAYFNLKTFRPQIIYPPGEWS